MQQNNDNFLRCENCGKPLGAILIYPDKEFEKNLWPQEKKTKDCITLLDQMGNTYKVAFSRIDIDCNNCGYANVIESDHQAYGKVVGQEILNKNKVSVFLGDKIDNTFLHQDSRTLQLNKIQQRELYKLLTPEQIEVFKKMKGRQLSLSSPKEDIENSKIVFEKIRQIQSEELKKRLEVLNKNSEDLDIFLEEKKRQDSLKNKNKEHKLATGKFGKVVRKNFPKLNFWIPS